jgi:uncharacterized protein
VLVSAILSPRGTPARLLRAWRDGAFELVVSPALLGEVDRVLRYPKIARRINTSDAIALRELLEGATLVSDPDGGPSVRASDPDDDYLIALAEAQRAVLVTGDRVLVALSDRIPVYEPAAFLALVDDPRSPGS